MTVHQNTLHILRQSVWQTLSSRLDSAVAHQPASLGPARDAVVRPIHLLELLTADTAGALGDDALSAERMRMLLHLSWSFGAAVEEARAFPPSINRSIAGKHPAPAAQYQPGVLDHGVLALVALAVVRVAPPGMEPLFLRAVHGLALWCASLEALGRLEPRLPDAGAIATILGTLELNDAVGAAIKSPLLRPFASDPAEHARRECLFRLLHEGPLGAEAESPGPWDGAASASIESIEPDKGCPPGSLLVKLAERHRLPPKAIAVFAAPGEPVRAAPFTREDRLVRVRVPAGTPSGWLGFTDDAMIDAANAHRAAMKQKLAALSPTLLGGASVPLGALGPIGHKVGDRRVAEPPRGGNNRFEGDACNVVVAPLLPHWDDVMKAWAAARARPFGSRSGHSRRAPSALAAKTDGAPPISLDVSSATTRSFRIVLVVPTIVDMAGTPKTMPSEHARGYLGAAARLLAMNHSVHELPFVEDELAALAGTVRTADDPRVPSLLNHLSRRAMLTPDWEDALWLMLLPLADATRASIPPAMWAAESAEAALAVAVANVEGLVGLGQFLLHENAVAAPVTERLRVLGALDRELTFESVQEERRAAGPGASLKTDVAAVALDADRNELSTVAVHAVAGTRPLQIASLLPVSSEVVAMEFRRGSAVLGRLERPSEKPTVALKRQAGQTLTWSYDHPENIGGRVSLLVGTSDISTPVLDLDRCVHRLDLPAQRFRNLVSLTLTASDGWNEADDRISFEAHNPRPVVLRRLTDGRYYADAPDELQPLRWELDGRVQGTGRVLTLPPRATGMLTLHAGEITDSRQVP